MDLFEAAKRAKDLAFSLTSPGARVAFLELAARWEAKAKKRAPEAIPDQSGTTQPEEPA